MRQSFEKIAYRVGSKEILEAMPSTPSLAVFSDQALEFLNALSGKLMKLAREYPDVMTFAFWCRKASLLHQKANYSNLDRRIGHGVSFHIAPSNVPINCAFTMAAGLLAGNATIVRLPSKDFTQVSMVCNAINTLLANDYDTVAPYLTLIQYPHDDEVTSYLSSLCDTRVIWGGDQTIESIRKAPLKPRANEITFSDRYSMCVIHADGYLSLQNKEKVATDFYNDTYLSDQNACTSPRLIVWLGIEKERAKAAFWEKVSTVARERYPLAGVQTVGKLSAFCNLATKKDVRLLSDIHEWYAVRVGLNELSADLMDYRYNSGYFFEYDAQRLDEMLPVLTEKLQTISYLGMDSSSIVSLVQKYRPRGVDRIVPMGQTMEFDLFWDGYDLMERMSRYIDIR